MHFATTFGSTSLDVWRIKPYITENSPSTARPYAPRPAIWLEAGFERANKAGTKVAFGVLSYLNQSCPNDSLEICNNDYYILSNVDSDGSDKVENLAREGTIEPLSKTTESKTPYQQFVDSQPSPVLSITLSKLGSKITAPYAPTKLEHSDKERYQTLMDVFTARATSYTSGFHADVHGRAHGDSMDYNDRKYNGNRFNVALQEGTVDPDNKYVDSNEEFGRMFEEFGDGFFHLVDYVVQNY